MHSRDLYFSATFSGASSSAMTWIVSMSLLLAVPGAPLRPLAAADTSGNTSATRSSTSSSQRIQADYTNFNPASSLLPWQPSGSAWGFTQRLKYATISFALRANSATTASRSTTPASSNSPDGLHTMSLVKSVTSSGGHNCSVCGCGPGAGPVL